MPGKKRREKKPRILHVSYNYWNFENTSVEALLGQTTARFVERFKKIAKGEQYGAFGAGSAREAMILQDFFRTIKNMDNDKSLEGAAYRTIINNTLKNHFPEGSRKLFKTGMTGLEFEQLLGALITETIGFSATSSIDTKALASSTILGTKSFTVGKYNNNISESMNIPEYLARDLLMNAEYKISAVLRKELGNIKDSMAKVTIKERGISNAKIDVTGTVLFDIEIDEGNELSEIARLLQMASFSAKNYSLNYAKQQLKTEVLGDIQLRLGNANLDTVFFSLFGSDFPAPVVLSMFFYAINTKNTDVQMKLNQLRFIYELTGYGQHYRKGDIAIEDKINRAMSHAFKNLGFSGDLFRANYFIWNNPDSGGDIYVRSTADLIAELYDSLIDAIIEDFDRTLYLKASFIGA